MSTNALARPQSRRSLLTALAAGTVAGGATFGVQAAGATIPDPIFALIEAEMTAWDAVETTSLTSSIAEDELMASGWDRKPRVRVGEYTSMVRGPDHEPIPPDEQTAEPVYVHSHGAIDQDCDSHARAPGADLAKVEARRARLHRELDEDAAALIARGARSAEAEEVYDKAFRTWQVASNTLVAATPRTAAGLLALIERFKVRVAHCMVDPERDGLDNILVHVRSFLSREA